MNENYEQLKSLVDDGTTYVEVETPKGWKCDRKGCNSDFLHKHSTYDIQ
jgi:hypothetical protein